MSRKTRLWNNDHLISRSKEGSDTGINIKRVSQIIHRAKHIFFNNKKPHEQVRFLLDYNRTILTPEAFELLNSLCTRLIIKWSFYRPEAFACPQEPPRDIVELRKNDVELTEARKKLGIALDKNDDNDK